MNNTKDCPDCKGQIQITLIDAGGNVGCPTCNDTGTVPINTVGWMEKLILGGHDDE